MKRNFKKAIKCFKVKKYVIFQCHLQDQMATFPFNVQNLGSTFLFHYASVHAVSALQPEYLTSRA